MNNEEVKKLENKDDSQTIATLVDFYNQQDKFPKIKKLTKGRMAKIKTRLKDVGYDNLIKAIEVASKNTFLTGQTKNSNWKADLDWFIENDTNAFKVLEGKYNDNSSTKGGVESVYGDFIN